MQPHVVRTQILTQFHDEFSGSYSAEQAIEAMRELGTVVIKDKKHKPYKERVNFERAKKVRISMKLGKQCFACSGSPQCRHHLVWIKHGGKNHKRNIVTLCYSCHAAVHPWLADD